MNYTGKRPEELYSKGIFTNSFPIALANWMDTKGIQPRYVEGRIGNAAHLEVNLRDARDIFDGIDPGTLHFDFEKPYEPFSKLHSEEESRKLTKMDVVASDPLFSGRQIKGLENKLTVVPDSSTHLLPEEQHAPEMVLRPASVAAACSSLYLSMSEDTKNSLRLLYKTLKLSSIRDWTNESEMLKKYPAVSSFIEGVLSETQHVQRAFLLQPIWATHGLSWLPRKLAFDLLVWSDHALLTLIYLESQNGDNAESATGSKRGRKKGEKLGRSRRTIIRMCLMFNELLFDDEYNFNRSFKDICFDEQTDKEGSIPGKRILAQVGSEPFVDRRIPFTDIFEIIPLEGMDLITPERRCDLTIKMIWILHIKFGHSFEEIYEKMGISWQ
ncbi:HindVP restriction endonuclease [compost metagenome]